MSDKSQSLPKPARDNRSRQINPQDPVYHRSRERSPREADQLSTEKTQENQESSDK